jgi:hypothetical protein
MTEQPSSGRETIYGDYVAPAVSSRGGSAWHIQGTQPDLALCGKRLTGDLGRMVLHVSLLECSKCMSLGTDAFPRTEDDPAVWAWACPECGWSTKDTRLEGHVCPGPRRAPVNGQPHGTVSWAEHEEAWRSYHRLHPRQDAETIAARGGFGLVELTQQLGRVPTTWQPDDRTDRRYFPRG